jgi:hypothetical protein
MLTLSTLCNQPFGFLLPHCVYHRMSLIMCLMICYDQVMGLTFLLLMRLLFMDLVLLNVLLFL